MWSKRGTGSSEVAKSAAEIVSIIPPNNAAFRTYGQDWWAKTAPNVNGNWTETEPARQWDERIRRTGDGNNRTRKTAVAATTAVYLVLQGSAAHCPLTATSSM